MGSEMCIRDSATVLYSTVYISMGPYGVPGSLSMGPYGVPGSRDSWTRGLGSRDSGTRDLGSRDSGTRDLGSRDLGTRAQGWGPRGPESARMADGTVTGNQRFNSVRFGSQKIGLNRSSHFLNFSTRLRREFPTASSGYVDPRGKKRGMFPKIERNIFGECRPPSRRAR